MKITLKILARDIKKDNYLNPDKCPITKALKRAGHPKLKDTGAITYKGETLANCSNKGYRKLLHTLYGMYNSIGSHHYSYQGVNTLVTPDPTPIKDFTIDLIIRKYE